MPRKSKSDQGATSWDDPTDGAETQEASNASINVASTSAAPKASEEPPFPDHIRFESGHAPEFVAWLKEFIAWAVPAAPPPEDDLPPAEETPPTEEPPPTEEVPPTEESIPD